MKKTGHSVDSMSDGLVAASTALARRGIPLEVIELLINGDPARDISPGALEAVIRVWYWNKEIKK